MDKQKREKESERDPSSSGKKRRSKHKRDKEKEEQDRLAREYEREREAAAASGSSAEGASKNRWGWKGNRVGLDVGRVSRDISVERTKSQIGFGTAPTTEYDYSILHRYKSFTFDQSEAEDERKELFGKEEPPPPPPKKEEKKEVGWWKWTRGKSEDKGEEQPEERKQSLEQEEPKQEEVEETQQSRQSSLKSEEEKKEPPPPPQQPSAPPKQEPPPPPPEPKPIVQPPPKPQPPAAPIPMPPPKQPPPPTPTSILKPQPVPIQKPPPTTTAPPPPRPPPVAIPPPQKPPPPPPSQKPSAIPPPPLPQKPPTLAPPPPKSSAGIPPPPTKPPAAIPPPPPPQKPPLPPSVPSKAGSPPPRPKTAPAAPTPSKPTPPRPPVKPELPPPPSTGLSTFDLTSALSDTSFESDFSGSHKSKHRKHRPRPSELSIADFDIDEELSTFSDEGSKVASLASKRTSLSIYDDTTPKHPDDELLFTLTAKEEIVFRKSISEMRWEEEESMSEETAYTTEGSSSEMESTAAALLWERIGAGKRFVTPTIVVNDRRISLSHLDPEEGEETEPPPPKETYQDMFRRHSNESQESSDSDDDPVQAIMDLMDDAEDKRRKSQHDEDRKSTARSKLWRRRLIVVVLLNFVMKFRRRFNTFCELVVPVIVCGVVVSGMIWNSDGAKLAASSDIIDQEAAKDKFDPFEKIGTEAIFTAFCSNEEFCGKKSTRYYYIVYSPKNNFTENLLKRVVHIMGLEEAKQNLDPNKFDQKFGNHKEHIEGSYVSKLIGVENATEVERQCREHWKRVSKYDTEKANDESDFYEQKLNKLKEESKLVRFPIGIIFSFEGNMVGKNRMEKIEADQDIPKTLTFAIRTFYPEVANTVEGFPFREQRVAANTNIQGQRHFQSTPYLHTGIIGFQIALDMAFAEKIVEKSEKLDPFMEIGDTKVSRRAFLRTYKKEPAMKQFEYPTYKGPIMRVRGWLALTTSVVFSYIVGDILVAQDVIHEQNRGSIELLKIHGMTTSMRWIANLIICGFLRAFTSLAMALIIHYQYAIDAVASFSSPLFLWLFLWMHACTMTCFNYFITSGFGIKKPELAGLTVVCVCFLTFLCPVHFFVEGYLNRFGNVALCFFLPSWNLANGIYYYLRYEMYEEGLDWYDFPVLMDTETHKIIALPLSCNIFLYSTMFYLSLTIYMDHILPREFSPRETWLFFCKPFTRKAPSQTQATRPIPRTQKPSVYELGPKDTAYGPRFRNVTVADSRNKITVLDNISLDIYEGEVTCIVGQIGSGKSDFLNVIAGVNIPSSGFVDVKGLKVHEYHDITNRYVSLCPQKRLLIETLSVEDHIRLCCMLHGASYHKAKTQATFLLKMFGLMSMRRHSYQGLTTNDTKKLMLAMALSKSPSVLLLDNPIDQLDSESRFQFWKLLQELKPQRSIVVTCTTLEEAQLYGDRIAVLSKGKLVCYGSPQYLRLAYGIGNVMTLRMSEGQEPDIWSLQELMHKELLGAKTTLLETKGISLQADTVKFIMPFGKFYGGVLEKLEDNLERFGIAKISMSQPSLWALFHKIATHAGIEQVLARREIRMMRGGDPDEHEGFERAVEPPIPVQKEDIHSFPNIMGILVLKKIWYYRQKYFTFLLAYIPQMILLLLVVNNARLFLIDKPEALSRVISPRMYENNYIIFRTADNEHTRKGWEEAFTKVIKDDDTKAELEIFDYDDDLEAFLATGQAHTLTHYKKQTLVAFSRDKTGHVGYYSSNSLHAGPIASHVMMQAFLYMISPDRNDPYATVLVTHPFIQYPGFPAGSTQSNSSTILGLFLSLILCLLSAPVLRMLLTERSSKFKALQRMTGVSSWMYWLSHGIADYGLYVIITVICWGLMVFFDNIGYQQLDGWEERLALWIILGGWLCWAALPYTYLLACLMPNKITGYGHYILYHFMLGIIPKVVTYQFFRLFVTGFYKYLRYMLYIFPPYSITSACVHFFHVAGDERWCRKQDPYACEMYENATRLLEDRDFGELMEHIGTSTSKNPKILTKAAHKFLLDQINFNDTFRTCCKAYCEKAGTCHSNVHFFQHDGDVVIPNLRHDIYALLVNGFVYWLLVILYELELIQSLCSILFSKVCGNLERTVAQRDVKTSDEPEDVKQEHQKVDYMVEIEGDVDSEVYLVQDVTKFYKYTKGLDHIYFSVPIHQVTGLLGLPKCGKTTILEILTCQLAPSSGYVYKDNDLLEGRSKRNLMMKVGYCPQKSCLLSYLTGSQMLTVMGRLRGLSKRECEQHVLWWVQLFELVDVANKKCSSLKKGQEQRLCCALALIGDTTMVIFDEPTASMDNFERYTFWNIISRLGKFNNRTVLFASINADEVQHQSNKALLMESGTLVAVGQLTEIFKNNNQGMTLTIRYGLAKKYTEFQKKAKLDKLKDHVIQYLSPCALMDEQENLLIYHLKDQNLKLSRVYSVMEGAKVKFTTLLEHFQVSEPSLDDIILQFHKARTKRQERTSGNSGAAADEISTTPGTAKDKANPVAEV